MRNDNLERLFGELANAELPVPAARSVLVRARQRRRRAHGRVAFAAVAAAAVAMAAVVNLSGSDQRHSPPAGHPKPSLAMCQAAPDVAISAGLARELPASAQTNASPIAMSQNGKHLYVETSTPGFHGMAEESTATGAILTRIQHLPAAIGGAEGALGPDGDVVWMNTYSTHGGQGAPGTTAVQLWSPQTGRATALEPFGQRRDALSAPVLSGPDNELAAWEQADGSTQEIVEADLATGATDVIAHGPVGPPVFVGGDLVWPVAQNAASAFVYGRDSQSPSRLVAVRASVFPAGGQIAVPQALRAAGSASLIVSNGSQTAYASPDETELFFSPSPSQPARLVLRLTGGNTLTPGELVLGAGYLSWGTASAVSYLASTSTMAMAAIPGFSSLDDVGAGYVIVAKGTGSKLHQQIHLHLFSASTISALKCARPAKPTSH